MRTIGVVTVGRSDYGILLPVLRRIQADSDLRLVLFVAGSHLSPEFGLTVREIEQDGFEIAQRIETVLPSDAPEGIARSIGLGLIGFAQAYARLRPDLLLVIGDRFEVFSAVSASLPFAIPVAHIHGGESTEGLIDDPIRHSITKMSHLHFASTEFYARRIIQMGEEPWRVVVSGAPSLDHLRSLSLLSEEALSERFGVDPQDPPLLITHHPVTLEFNETEAQVEELLAALEELDRPMIFTYPNADTMGRRVIERIQEFAKQHERARVVANLGTQAFFSLMRDSAAMVGNSSSGIIEAASFKLPVVNIGNRQRGRLHAANVIDVGTTRSEIVAGLRRALSPEFRAGLSDLVNPYGNGDAAEKVVRTLKDVPLDDQLLMKRFYSDGETLDADPVHRGGRV